MSTNAAWTVIFDDKTVIKNNGPETGTGYVINDDDTVNIEESFESGFRKSNITNVISLDEAIKDQQRYIKLGYDKIS